MTEPKPKHLETMYAEQFKDEAIVNAYHNRPAYAAELFPFLAEMTKGEPKRVLDAGCGLGHIARPLSQYVDHVDAVDFSKQMLKQGKQLQHGEASNLNWICAPIETAPLTPPYGLITAGQSLHWFNWDIALPRFADLLVANGYLVVVGRNFTEPAWQPELMQLIAQFSTNRDYQPYNIFDELEKRDLFIKEGAKNTQPKMFSQTLNDYIEAIHSSNGFSRDRMTAKNAQAFDEAVRKLVWAHVGKESFATAVSTSITWGYPQIS